MSSGYDEFDRRLQMAKDDRGRLALLMVFAEEIRSSDPGHAVEVATHAIRIATTISDSSTTASILYGRGISLLALRRYRDAGADLRDSYELYVEAGDDEHAVGAALALGEACGAAGDAKAIVWLHRGLELASKRNLSGEQARARESLGNLAAGLGDYLRALDHFFKCLALQQELNNPDGIGIALSMIARVYGLTGDSEGAFDHYSRSLEVFRTTGNKIQEVKALANLGGVHLSRNELDKALEHYMVTLAIYDMLGDRVSVITTLVCIGNIYERRSELEAAREFYYRAWDAAEEATDGTLQSSILLNIGNICRRIGDYVRGRLVLEHALAIAQSIDEPRLQYQIHEALALVYEQLEYPAQALDHYKRFAQLRHELAGQEKQKEIAKLQVQFDVATAEREREILRLKAEKLEAGMQIKQNELVAQALHLVQKNQLLDTLKTQVKELSHDRGGKNGEVVDDIVDLIDATRGGEQDWKNFEEQLSMVYPDFVRTLADRFPTLTATELRVCCLLKMNRTTKEMANIMFSSARTIEVHRYNIRKKLGLDGKGGLSPFLAGI